MRKRRILCALFCAVLSTIPVYAAFNEGSAADLPSFVTEAQEKKETKKTEEKKAEEEKTEEKTASETKTAEPEVSGEIYTFNGKKYTIASDWGQHYLTGYGPNEDGSCSTASGRDATAGYTVSSTRANLGKVILVKAEKGSSRYDGIYVCEDTGGPAVETGKENTMNTPVVDIFFDTTEEADAVTASGWITARIYILKEVK